MIWVSTILKQRFHKSGERTSYIMSGYMTVIKYSVETLHVTSLHCGYYG